MTTMTSTPLSASGMTSGADALGTARSRSRAAAAYGNATTQTGTDRSLDATRQAAQEFVAFFASQMIQPMFEGIKTDEMFGGGVGEDSWKSMMIDQYGKELARQDGLGLTDQVMTAMLEAQEKARNSGTTAPGISPAASEKEGME